MDEYEALRLYKKYDINPQVVPFDTWIYALEVELEHGLKNKRTNITNDDLDMTAKIALAHLEENHLYYDELKKMEAKLESIPKKSPYIDDMRRNFKYMMMGLVAQMELYFNGSPYITSKDIKDQEKLIRKYYDENLKGDIQSNRVMNELRNMNIQELWQLVLKL